MPAGAAAILASSYIPFLLLKGWKHAPRCARGCGGGGGDMEDAGPAGLALGDERGGTVGGGGHCVFQPREHAGAALRPVRPPRRPLASHGIPARWPARRCQPAGQWGPTPVLTCAVISLGTLRGSCRTRADGLLCVCPQVGDQEGRWLVEEWAVVAAQDAGREEIW